MRLEVEQFLVIITIQDGMLMAFNRGKKLGEAFAQAGVMIGSKAVSSVFTVASWEMFKEALESCHSRSKS